MFHVVRRHVDFVRPRYCAGGSRTLRKLGMLLSFRWIRAVFIQSVILSYNERGELRISSMLPSFGPYRLSTLYKCEVLKCSGMST